MQEVAEKAGIGKSVDRKHPSSPVAEGKRQKKIEIRFPDRNAWQAAGKNL